MGMTAKGQFLQLTASGINGYTVGMPVSEAKGLIPFDSCRYKELFQILPSGSGRFFCLDLPADTAEGALPIRYVLVFTGGNGQISRFLAFIDDSRDEALFRLNDRFGPYEVSGEGFFAGSAASLQYLWTTGTGMTLHLFRHRTEHPLEGYPVSTLDIYREDAPDDYTNYMVVFNRLLAN